MVCMQDTGQWIDCYHKEHPMETGWYAVLRCYDVEEGILSGANYWDGSQWLNSSKAMTQFSSIKFSAELDAKNWAYDNNPEQV